MMAPPPSSPRMDLFVRGDPDQAGAQRAIHNTAGRDPRWASRRPCGPKVEVTRLRPAHTMVSPSRRSVSVLRRYSLNAMQDPVLPTGYVDVTVRVGPQVLPQGTPACDPTVTVPEGSARVVAVVGVLPPLVWLPNHQLVLRKMGSSGPAGRENGLWTTDVRLRVDGPHDRGVRCAWAACQHDMPKVISLGAHMRLTVPFMARPIRAAASIGFCLVVYLLIADGISAIAVTCRPPAWLRHSKPLTPSSAAWWRLDDPLFGRPVNVDRTISP